MTSLKQIEANRLNAGKSTGPRSEEGKQRSRRNALRHGLTTETVIAALEHAPDYQAFEASIASDYQPRSATDRELVSRLASVLWRLRRSTSTETGLLQIQGELMQSREARSRGQRTAPPPQWYGELDVCPTANNYPIGPPIDDVQRAADSQTLAYCFLQASRLQYGTFDLLTRYETALWRQATQLLFMLQSVARR